MPNTEKETAAFLTAVDEVNAALKSEKVKKLAKIREHVLRIIALQDTDLPRPLVTELLKRTTEVIQYCNKKEVREKYYNLTQIVYNYTDNDKTALMKEVEKSLLLSVPSAPPLDSQYSQAPPVPLRNIQAARRLSESESSDEEYEKIEQSKSQDPKSGLSGVNSCKIAGAAMMVLGAALMIVGIALACTQMPIGYGAMVGGFALAIVGATLFWNKGNEGNFNTRFTGPYVNPYLSYRR